MKPKEPNRSNPNRQADDFSGSPTEAAGPDIGVLRLRSAQQEVVVDPDCRCAVAARTASSAERHGRGPVHLHAVLNRRPSTSPSDRDSLVFSRSVALHFPDRVEVLADFRIVGLDFQRLLKVGNASSMRPQPANTIPRFLWASTYSGSIFRAARYSAMASPARPRFTSVFARLQ